MSASEQVFLLLFGVASQRSNMVIVDARSTVIKVAVGMKSLVRRRKSSLCPEGLGLLYRVQLGPALSM